MQADKGKKVTIGFVCRFEDGTLYNLTERTILTFTVGEGQTLPSLDAGVIGMSPGEHRIIRLLAAEVDQYPLIPETASSSAGIPEGSSRAPNGYEFAPGADGDIITPSQPRAARARAPLPPGTVLMIHVKLCIVED